LCNSLDSVMKIYIDVQRASLLIVCHMNVPTRTPSKMCTFMEMPMCTPGGYPSIAFPMSPVTLLPCVAINNNVVTLRHCDWRTLGSCQIFIVNINVYMDTVNNIHWNMYLVCSHCHGQSCMWRWCGHRPSCQLCWPGKSLATQKMTCK
jgi:hypothetical protein